MRNCNYSEMQTCFGSRECPCVIMVYRAIYLKGQSGDSLQYIHTYSTMKTLWLLSGGPSLKVILHRAVKLLCTDSSSPQQSVLCVHLHDDTLTTLDMESHINTPLIETFRNIYIYIYMC